MGETEGGVYTVAPELALLPLFNAARLTMCVLGNRVLAPSVPNTVVLLNVTDSLTT